MRVVARGWKRDCGTNEVMSSDLERGYEQDSVTDVYRNGKTYLRNRSNGDVEILTGPHQLNFGGKYQVIVNLAKGDIARLFAESFKDADLFETINELANLSK